MTQRAEASSHTTGKVAAVAAVLLSAAVSQAGTPPRLGPKPGMAKVLRQKFVLGSTPSDLVEVASWCNRASPRPRCSPEDFAEELTSGELVVVDDFWLDRQEVSNEHYQRCVEAGSCRPPKPSSEPRVPTHPVTSITYFDAVEYCHFRGARLPTELEFESAARGSLGQSFPWGNLYHHGQANAGSPGPRRTDASDGFQGLAPTDAFISGRSPAGVLQLSGNAAEWTASPFTVYGSERSTSSRRSVRGGHFAAAPWWLRASAREGVAPTKALPTIGFRCARSLD